MLQNIFLAHSGNDLAFVQNYVRNFNLFWKHREQILADPRLYCTRIPFKIQWTLQQTLGTIAEAWSEHAELFMYQCIGCKGDAPIFGFAKKSPQSPCECIVEAYCPKCRAAMSSFSDNLWPDRTNALLNIYLERIAHNPEAETAITPFSLAEAVDYLKKLEQK